MVTLRCRASVCVAALSVAPVLTPAEANASNPSTDRWELTVEGSWPVAAEGVAHPPGTPSPIITRVKASGRWGRAFALFTSGDTTARAGADLGRVVAGPVSLAGAIGELRDPWSLTTTSGAFDDATGLQLDGALQPTSRQGVQLRVPLGDAVDIAALLASRQGSPATAALVASLRAEGGTTAEAFWLSRDAVAPERPTAWMSDAPSFPGGQLHHIGVRGLVDGERWRLGGMLAGGGGDQAAPAALLRLAATRRGALWDTSGMLVASTPELYDHDGRAASSVGLVELALRRSGRFMAELAGRVWFGRGVGALRSPRSEPRRSAATLGVGTAVRRQGLALELANEVEVAAAWSEDGWQSEADQHWRASLEAEWGQLAATVSRSFAEKPTTRVQTVARAGVPLAMGPVRGEIGARIDARWEWLAAAEAAPLPIPRYRGAVTLTIDPLVVSVDAEMQADQSITLTAQLRLHW